MRLCLSGLHRRQHEHSCGVRRRSFTPHSCAYRAKRENHQYAEANRDSGPAYDPRQPDVRLDAEGPPVVIPIEGTVPVEDFIGCHHPGSSEEGDERNEIVAVHGFPTLSAIFAFAPPVALAVLTLTLTVTFVSSMLSMARRLYAQSV